MNRETEMALEALWHGLQQDLSDIMVRHGDRLSPECERERDARRKRYEERCAALVAAI